MVEHDPPRALLGRREHDGRQRRKDDGDRGVAGGASDGPSLRGTGDDTLSSRRETLRQARKCVSELALERASKMFEMARHSTRGDGSTLLLGKAGIVSRIVEGRSSAIATQSFDKQQRLEQPTERFL